jgi:hypothetical protein
MKAIVDPHFSIPYHTYLLRGLLDLGYKLQFRELSAPSGGGIAFEIGGRRVYADTDDMPDVEPAPYAWADIFGKVNLAEGDHHEIRALGPLFGIRLWTLPAGYLQLRHFRHRAGLAGLRFQGITRLPIEAYRPGPVERGHVFHRSRAWAGGHAATNGPRERFIEALEASGLAGDPPLLTDDRIPLAEYLERTRRSELVFNSPAVHRCLGWKLGEYLALGKAIVSTPLERVLPAPLVHGEHIHYVEDTVEGIGEGIEQIHRDEDYRRHLEFGARAWWAEHLTPAGVVSRLVMT